MKRLLTITLLFLSIGVFAQGPTVNDGFVTVQANQQNQYFVDYSQFVFPLVVNPLAWGIGYIDLDVSTKLLDSYIDTPTYECRAWYDSKYLLFEPHFIGFPGTSSEFVLTYYIVDTAGNRSNFANLTLRVMW